MTNSIELRAGLDKVVESSTLAINQRVAALRAEDKCIFHFGFGESPFPVPEAMRQALADNAHQKSYLPTKGLLELREAISTYYQEQFSYGFDAENIFIAPGSKELLFQMLFLLDGPLLLPAPSWVSYAPQAQLCGKQVEVVPARYEDRYQITAASLQKACDNVGSGQKILILNFPNNPTGQCLDVATAKSLAEVCRANNVIVISDEIYALTQHDGGKQVSIVDYYPEGSIVTGGLSKAFSAGGYRFGLALLPETLAPLREALIKTISETYSCVSSPIQYAALKVYGDYPSVKDHVDQCTQVHALAGKMVHQRFVDMGLRCLSPQGGFYLYPDFSAYKDGLAREGIKNDRELAFYLLDNYSIATLPGSDFSSDSSGFCLRIAMVDYDGKDVLAQYAAGEKDPDVLFSHMNKACDALQGFVKEIS